KSNWRSRPTTAGRSSLKRPFNKPSYPTTATNSASAASNPSAPSLNHLIRAHHQRLRDRDAQCFRRFQVDHELEFVGLRDREVAGLGTLQDAVDVGRCTVPRASRIDAIANERTAFGGATAWPDERKTACQRPVTDLLHL